MLDVLGFSSRAVFRCSLQLGGHSEKGKTWQGECWVAAGSLSIPQEGEGFLRITVALQSFLQIETRINRMDLHAQSQGIQPCEMSKRAIL